MIPSMLAMVITPLMAVLVTISMKLLKLQVQKTSLSVVQVTIPSISPTTLINTLSTALTICFTICRRKTSIMSSSVAQKANPQLPILIRTSRYSRLITFSQMALVKPIMCKLKILFLPM